MRQICAGNLEIKQGKNKYCKKNNNKKYVTKINTLGNKGLAHRVQHPTEYGKQFCKSVPTLR
tara:strand:- start:5221 stop:5406 length:186 start_codon:yes stop_codon:yes gene_type:complete